MKQRIFILCWMLFIGFGYIHAQGGFQLKDLQVSAGTTAELPVSLFNDSPLIGFQFDLQLPPGIQIGQTAGNYQVRLSGRNHPTHTVSCNRLSSGLYRILVTSFSNATFASGSGEVLSVGLTIDKSVDKTTHPYSISNTLLVWSDKSQTTPLVNPATIRVQEHGAFEFPALELAPGQPGQMGVALTHSDPVIAFQCDLVLPEGIRLAGGTDAIKLTGRKQDHTLTYRSIGANSYRIIALSMSNLPFRDLAGDLFTVAVETDKQTAESTRRIVFRNSTVSLDKGIKLTLAEASNTIRIRKIKVDVQSLGSGSVSGSGLYNYQDEVSLKATPLTGFKFVKWMADGRVLSEQASFTFLAEKPIQITGEFARDMEFLYPVTASATNGLVEGLGNYTYGSEATLKAIPNTGYSFVAWKKDGVVVSKEAVYTFKVTEAVNLVAEFAINSFAVSATAENGTIEGTGNFTYGSEATLKAIPNTGYSFVAWKKDGEVVSKEAVYTFKVTEAVALVAEFAINSYAVSATAENGTIEGLGNFTYGSEATLKAIPNTGYSFVAWKKDGEVVSKEAVYTFKVTEAVNLTAEFAINSFAVSATGENGTIEGLGNFIYGSEATLKAIPNTGYSFVAWKKDGVVVSKEATYTFKVTEAVALVAEFAINSFAVSATGENGTIEGLGNFTYGSEATLKAIPNTGYSFIAWKKDGEVVSKEAVYTFKVTEAVALVAEFAINSFAVSATGENGTIEGTGNFTYGSEATLKAIPNTGYSFIAWKKDGVVVSKEATYTFKVTEAVALVAEFAINSYSVSATAENGTIEGLGNFTYGSEATLKAIPNTGYSFVAWKKDGVVVSKEAVYTFKVTEAVNLVAEFAINSYAVSATGENGTIEGLGNFTYGSEAILKAIPNTGYSFVAWKKDGVVVSKEAVYTFKVTEAVALVAEFAINSFAVSATAENGTIEGTGNFTYGSEATLKAIPNTGYSFVAWKKDGEVVSKEAVYTFKVTEAVNLTAEFAINSFAVSAIAENGTIEGLGNFTYGSEATLKAIPNTGYSFVAWKKDGEVVSKDATYTFKVTEAVNLTAEFVINSFAVSATGENGTIEGAGNFTYGSEATLKAIPNTGYSFVAWKNDRVVVSKEAVYTFKVTEAVALVAEFAINSFAVSATAENGTIEGTGNFTYGSEATLKAIPNTGYSFVAWKKDGVVVSKEAVYTFKVTEAVALVAEFAINSFAVSATGENGTIEGTGTFTYGSEAILKAIPNTGYSFVAWKKDGEVVSKEATYTFKVTEAVNLTAEFVINSFAVSATAENGTIEGLGNFTYDSEATLKAIPNTGYSFVAWRKDGVVVSKEAVYTFKVTEAVALVAEFAINSFAVSATGENGTIEGTGSFTYGSEATLKAIPNTGYSFVAWKKDGVVVNKEAVYTFKVTEAVALVAEFAINSFAVSATGENGTIEGTGTFTYGSEATLKAIPNTGYSFVAWKKDGVVVSKDAVYTFKATEAVALVAEFAINSFAVSATGENGTIEGLGNFTYGSEATLKAIPNTGYTFVAWKKDGVVVSNEAVYTFKVTEAVALVVEFAINSFAVSATGENGTIEGTGNFTYGSEATLKAIPNTGYSFVAWKKDGGVVSKEAVYTFKVTEAVALVAEFAINSFAVSATGENGTIEGLGNFTYDSEATLKAIPNTGYSFVAWKKDGVVVSKEATYTFKVTEAVALVAEFAINSFAVSATGENGTIEGAGNFTYGSEATLKAIPNTGYSFVAWKKDGLVVSKEAVYTFKVTEAVVLVAEFAINSYAVSATGENGTIEGAGNFTYGSEATLKAIPNTGYSFIAWKKDGVVVSKEAVYTFKVTEAVALVAEFAINSFAVSATGENGTIEGTGNFTYGSEATLKAIPNTGYSFVAWKKDGGVVSKEAVYTFKVTEAVALVAEFAINSYAVSATGENGTIEGAGNFTYGSEATLKAIPNTGYSFIAWKKDGVVVSKEAVYTFKVTEAVALVAEFAINSFAVSATGENGTIEGTGNFTYGSEATLKAIPNTGYSFVAWKKDGEVVSKEATYTFKVTEAVALVAEFAILQHQITVTAENGTVQGHGDYQHGDEVMLETFPDEGYTFKHWEYEGRVVSKNPIIQFTVIGSHHLHAVFETATSIPSVDQDEVKIRISGRRIIIDTEYEIAQTHLIHLSGRIVAANQSNEIDGSGFETGIYILKIQLEGKGQITKKIYLK